MARYKLFNIPRMKTKVFLGALTVLSVSTLYFLSEQAFSQYSSDPGIAYGQNICLITTEMGLPLTAAAGVAASPMLGFQGPSRAIALRNGNVIMRYISQFNGNIPEKDAKQMTSTGLRWLVKNCRAGLSQNEYNWIMKDIKAGKI